jgi:YbbR domain-containing protein
MLRWFWHNLGSLLLAFFLALMVWASAVSAADPTQESLFPQPIPIDFVGLPTDLVVVGDFPIQATVTIRAPRSVWEELTASEIHLEADLSGAEPGGAWHVTLTPRIDRRPARVVSIDPRSLTLTVETVARRSVPVEVRTLGSPAVGYRIETPSATPATATVIGPASAVARVAQVLAEVDLTGLRQDVNETLLLIPVDPQGLSVEGVRVDPDRARVVAPVVRLGGYRDVAVKVVYQGQVEPGYWLWRISVTPPIITVYSADAEAVVLLPGFVETEPLVLTGASSDIERRLALNLPQGITPVGDQTVLVQVWIAPMGSLNITRSLEIEGLGQGLAASASPDSVNVILTGPLPVLESLAPEDVRVILDVTDLGAGTHQVTPRIIVSPAGVVAQAVLPATVEVTITLASQAPATSTP